jgi:hypothetical protein
MVLFNQLFILPIEFGDFDFFFDFLFDFDIKQRFNYLEFDSNLNCYFIYFS